jgi:hypothetical protein
MSDVFYRNKKGAKSAFFIPDALVSQSFFLMGKTVFLDSIILLD